MNRYDRCVHRCSSLSVCHSFHYNATGSGCNHVKPKRKEAAPLHRMARAASFYLIDIKAIRI
ncbi:PAN domain-containing protein [Paenibacillus sp. MMO-177]|uniref:PAN domain-containing protein n=1 Tax=Paenibacillus sp. MMO-177 TaxID=3081289 RepID=UPI003FA79991